VTVKNKVARFSVEHGVHVGLHTAYITVTTVNTTSVVSQQASLVGIPIRIKQIFINVLIKRNAETLSQ